MKIEHITLTREGVNASFETSGFEESVALMDRLRELEGLSRPTLKTPPQNGVAKDVPQVTHSEEVTKGEAKGTTEEPPKRKRGRPKMTEEQKAEAKRKREEKKRQEAEEARRAEEAAAAAAAEEEEEDDYEDEITEAEQKADAEAQEFYEDDEDEDDSLAAAADDDEEEEDEEEDEEEEDEEEDEEEALGSDLVAGLSPDVLANLRTMSKLRDILNTLKNEGIETAAHMAGVCESIKEEVPVLKRVNGLEQRVMRAAAVMGLEPV